jgi:hypothetical protein
MPLASSFIINYTGLLSLTHDPIQHNVITYYDNQNVINFSVDT